MEPLLPSFRRELRARAHALHPVVSIGQHGLTDAVLHEIDVALKAHELIKVRIFNDDRAARETVLARICEALGCAPVQQIGKLLVLWRPRPTDAPNELRSAAREPRSPRQTANGSHPPRRRRAVSTHSPAPVGKTPAIAGEAKRTSRPVSTAGGARRLTRSAATPPAGVPRALPRRRRRAS